MNEVRDSQLRVLVDLVWRARLLLLASLVSGVLAGVVAVWVTPPAYRVTATLLPANDIDGSAGVGGALGQASGLAALAGIANLGGDRTEEALAVLQSRKFTERFIVDEDLLPQLFPEKWDSGGKRWNVVEGEVPTLFDGFRAIEKRLSVRRDSRTGLIDVELIWSDPVVGAKLLNAMVKRVNDDLRQRDLSETNGMIKQLELELRNTDLISVEASVHRLIEANIKKRTLAKARNEYLLRVIDPAIEMGVKDRFRPRPLLYLAAGAFGGLLLGFVLISFRFLLARTSE